MQSRINAALQCLRTNLQVRVRHSVSVTCSIRTVGAGHLNIQHGGLGGAGHLDGVHQAASQLSLREGIAISNQRLCRVLCNLARGCNARLGRNIHLRGVSATGTGGINHQRVNNQRSLRSVLAIGHVAVDGTRHSENHDRQQNQQTVSENATYLAAKGNRGGMRGVIHVDILEEEKRTLNIGEKRRRNGRLRLRAAGGKETLNAECLAEAEQHRTVYRHQQHHVHDDTQHALTQNGQRR